MKNNTLFLFGNTHFDPVWLWKWDEAMASIRATFRSALDRMNEDSDYIYSFCTPPVFEWIKSIDPDMFEEIKVRVSEGRWDLAEGMWVQPDCNAPHGESLVRHGLYTQRYLVKTFGHMASTVFNIDSFGHCATMPQILSKCGIEFYVFARPAGSDYELPGPLFHWRSPDGSEVMALRCGHFEGKGMYPPMPGLDIKEDIAYHDNVMTELEHDYAIVFGVSNHGGAPTKECLRNIREMMDEGTRNLRFGSTTDFYIANKDADLPVIKDELQVRFFGPYSNDIEIKVNNRIAEYAAMRAEKAAVFAVLAQYPANFLEKNPGDILKLNPADILKNYPAEKLEQSWKDILFNQFHDIIGGASIKDAYFDARNLHGRAIQTLDEITHISLQSITKNICMPGNNTKNADWNIVIWNLNDTDLSQTFEAEVQWMWEFERYAGALELVDNEGIVYPCQIIRSLSVIPEFRSRFAFHALIPAHGYKVFAVVKKHKPAPVCAIKGNTRAIENSRYKLSVDDSSSVSIFDKHKGKTVAKDAFSLKVFDDQGDTWAFNFKKYENMLGPVVLTDSKIIETGDFITILKATSKYGSSIFEQWFTIYEHSDEIDYRYRINWNEKHAAVKLCFDLPEKCSQLTAANPYGCVMRPIDGLEYPVGEWLNVSGQNAGKKAGFSLLFKSVFAYDTDSDKLRLTLLRSSLYGDLRLNEPLDPMADYDYLNQGMVEGNIRFLPGFIDHVSNKIPVLASSYNNPAVIIAEANHDGELPASFQYMGIDSKTVMLSVIKKSEEGDDIILRLVEYGGAFDTALLTWLGKALGPVKMSPYEIKTLRLCFTDLALIETDMLEEK